MTARPARQAAPVAKLRIVQGKAPAHPTAWGWLLVAIVAVGLFFGLITANTAMDRAAFELQEIRAEIAAEQARFDQLRLEVARLSSPERIQPMAEELGLVYPDPSDIRTVTAAGVVVVRQDADRWTDIKSLVSASP